MSIISFSKIANGVYHASFGTPSDFYPLHITANAPCLDKINSLTDCELPDFTFAPTISKTDRELIIRFPVEKNQDFYGLGLQPLSFNHKYKSLTMKVNGNPKSAGGECPAPVPMVIFPAGYAIAIDSLERVTFHMGNIHPTDLQKYPINRARKEWWNGRVPMVCLEIIIPGENADVYVFSGDDMKDVVKRYVLYCGGGTIPPRTALGVWQRVHMNSTEKEVFSVIKDYRSKKFGLNVIGLEPGWHEQYNYPCSYAFSKERFPNPEDFLKQAKQENVSVNLWELPCYAENYTLYNKLKPYGFGDYCWENGVSTDLTIPEAANAVRDFKTEHHLKLGVSSYKTDAATPYPDHATLPSGMSGYTYCQIFGSLNMKNELEMFRNINRRTLGLTLSGNIGACGFPHVYYNDSTDLKNYVRLICNSGLVGLLWSPEMCDADKPEQWLRRIELATFSANMQFNGWWSGSLPWNHSSVAETARKYTHLRTRLMPYFYQAFSRFWKEGIPPFRPLVMEEYNEFTRDLDTEFMAGDDLLVAPMFYEEQQREVYLPQGVWYAFDTHEKFMGGKVYTVDAPQERIPVFVRDGAMIALLDDSYDYVPDGQEKLSLEVLCFGSSGKLSLYDDDGETFAYEHGDYGYLEMEFSDGKGRITADNRKSANYEKINFTIVL